MNQQFQNLNTDYFRFLTAGERQRAYVVILGCLFRERLDYQTQIFHDELYRKVSQTIEREQMVSYPEAQFRADIEQLIDWGNINRQIEGRRIRSLSDNSLRRNLLNITEETFQLFRFLQQQSKPQKAKTVARGFMLLIDFSELLKEFEAILESYYDGDRPPEKLQRALHLVELMDSKIEETVAELTGLAQQLHAFLETRNDFEPEDYQKLLSRLESYNRAYLSQLTREVNGLFLRLRNIETHACIDDFVGALNRAAAEADEQADGPIRRRLDSLSVFFNPDSGKLDFYNDRVNSELCDAIRRINNYLKIKGDRTLRIQEIRNRIREMTQTSAENACNWLNSLYSPVNQSLLADEGTPNNRQPAPMPRRTTRHPGRVRAARPVERKKAMTVEQTRCLERRNIQLINEFFLEKILCGRPQIKMCEAKLTSAGDVRKFLTGLKLVRLKSGRELHLIEFEIENPPKGTPPARFTLEDCEFSCPDHLIRRIRQ